MADLTSKTENELIEIINDFDQPDSVINTAEKILDKTYVKQLNMAVATFEKATPIIVSLTQDLMQLLDTISVNPIGDAFAKVNGLLDMAGEAYRTVAGIADERPNSATETATEAEEAPEEETVADTATSVASASAPTEAAGDIGIAEAAPPPGKVIASKKYAEIADEYQAMFAAAQIKPEARRGLNNTCRIVTTNRSRYESVAQPLVIPWWFVAIIHGLECSFKFSRHLHNGDPLTKRTVRVPPNRPPSSVGNPPFKWEVSAKDALIYEKFANLSDWSLPRVLYRWERYNGMGYRFKGIPSPYLWSFTDRYISGKYVADHQFDPKAVSKQMGAATILKRLQEQGDIDIS